MDAKVCEVGGLDGDTMTIRLLIVDDHEVVRSGLQRLLSSASNELSIVASSSNGEEALQLAVQHQPHVAVLDIRMDDGDGLAALEKIGEACPETATIMLSCFDNPTYIARSIALGAFDYVLKDAPLEQLVDSIARATSGRPPRQDSVTVPIRQAMQSVEKNSMRPSLLSKREWQVLRHLALGLSNREIARSMKISVDTVKEHVQKVLRKLGVKDRTQAAVWAVREGFLLANGAAVNNID